MGASPIEAVRALGKYSLVDKLGEGHLGPVYRGIDQDIDRAVAIRVLCDGIKWDAKVEELFLRECGLVAGLQHPNIAAIYHVGKEGPSHYVVMESLGANTLQSLIAQKAVMPAEAKLSIMIQAAEGLGHAHKKGILHRDLGPGKIHLMPDGSVKVRDFAIAHVLVKHLPHPVVRFGAPIYLSPEQIQQKEYDARSEIFSAGTIFYELLTYLHPFHDPNGNKALDNILQDLEIPTFERFPDAPPGIWTILKTCLARDPNDRYRSMDELSGAFRDLQKSLAEDTQLMLGELYASLTPLKKAAARPDASKDTIHLLLDIEKLSRGAKGADYASLDRLMTALIEQYPIIQAVADAPDLTNLQSPPVEVDLATDAAVLPVEKEVETTNAPQPEQIAAAVPAPSNLQASNGWCADTEQMIPPAPTAQENIAGDVEGNSLNAESPQTEPLPSSIIPGVGQEVEKPITVESSVDVSPLQKLAAEDASVHKDQPPKRKSKSLFRYRRIPRPSYRSAAVLLAILVLAAAGYIVWGTEIPVPVRNAWSVFLTNSRMGLTGLVPKASAAAEPTPAKVAVTQEGSDQQMASVLLKEARSLAAENRFDESKVLLKKILESNPADERALRALREMEERSLAAEDANDKPTREELARVSAMLDAGKLQVAKAELDRLQQNYPNAPEVLALRRRGQAKNSEQSRKEEEQKAVGKQSEEDRSLQVGELLMHGKYNEAAGALNLWLTENPESSRAQEFRRRIEEIQRNLRIYASAMSENRYQDALSALRSMERINPADPNVAEMRRQIETRKNSAKAVLTVHRLGGKANLLLDGRPIGNNGEIESESIPIGNHTLAIENGGGLIASRSQEYLEGQQVAYVYDLARLNLRPMSDADRESLAQRKATEEVHQFELEHSHGTFRGSCRGTLSIDYLDVAYKPSSGSHGFRIPLKLLKLRAEGTSVELFYISDNKHFQSFKLQDEQTMEQFKRVWSELKNVAR